MLSLDEAKTAILRDLDATIDLVERFEAADWERPTPCEGWTMRDLTRHVCEVAPMDADLIAGRGSGRPATHFEVPEPDAASMREGRKALAESLDGLDESTFDEICTYPTDVNLSLPCRFAMQVSAMEFGVHRYDVERALGRQASLAPDVVRAATSLAQAMLPFLAASSAEKPDRPVTIALRAPGVEVTQTFRDGAWTDAAPEDEPTCTITGEPEAITLFAVGRIPSTDPSLRVEGDAALAAKFKAFFPGP